MLTKRGSLAPSLLALAGTAVSNLLSAQTVTDEFMLTSRQVQTSLSYSHDTWDEYIGKEH